jgi:hypothetical protein
VIESAATDRRHAAQGASAMKRTAPVTRAPSTKRSRSMKRAAPQGTLSVAQLAAAMLDAARESLAASWPRIRDYAQPEFRRLAQSLVDITRLAAAERVTPAEARALLRIHRNTTLTVLLAIEGLGIVAVERAINAALGAVGDAVNGAIGFRLI